MSLASHKAGSAPRGRPSPGEAPSCSTVGGPAAGLGAPKGLPKTCGVLAVPCPAPASPRDGAPGGWCSGSQGACRPGGSPGGGLASAARRGEHRPLRVCQNPRNARRWPAVWTVGFGRRPLARRLPPTHHRESRRPRRDVGGRGARGASALPARVFRRPAASSKK